MISSGKITVHHEVLLKSILKKIFSLIFAKLCKIASILISTSQSQISGQPAQGLQDFCFVVDPPIETVDLPIEKVS